VKKLNAEAVLTLLKQKARPDQLEGMARYGMSTNCRLGVSIPDLREMAKNIGKKHMLAVELWRSGFSEAKILAAMIDEIDLVTEEQMDDWVKGFDSWDVCDQVCMNLFEKSPFALKKIGEWSQRDEEYVKRAAFALIACLAWHDKKAADEKFIGLFPILKSGSTDERNFVKKAVNWALRNAGKRNKNLNKAVIALSKEIRDMDSKSAKWIASDAIKELESEAVQRRLKNQESKLQIGYLAGSKLMNS
jgi:3-methyladenine DNA glycosylase AlkD